MAIRALISPITSKDSSVNVAMPTPQIIGTKLRYTALVCLSPIITRDRTTVNSGIVALTESKENKLLNKQKVRRYYIGITMFIYD